MTGLTTPFSFGNIYQNAIVMVNTILSFYLTSIGMMNNRNTEHGKDVNEDLDDAETGTDGSALRGYKAILLTPGTIVSLSRLLSKSKLRGVTVGKESGASAWKLLLEKLSKLGIGRVVTFRVRRNNTVVSNIVCYASLWNDI